MSQRILFCMLGPTCYKISVFKCRTIRNIKNLFGKEKLAKTKSEELLPNIVKSHSSILLRKLHGVDMQLQVNKATNLEIASAKITGIIINPGETFSFWKLIGPTTAKQGYKEGLVIKVRGETGSAIGGGLCQLANMIHWLVLNSPLITTEFYHHTDAIFPDDRRRVPFGTGTSVFNNYLDYRFLNNTNQKIQLILWVEDGNLNGELRSEEEFPLRYKLEEVDHHFSLEEGIYYRNSKVYRHVIDRKTGEEVGLELILNNHSKVLYDYSLIPTNQIR